MPMYTMPTYEEFSQLNQSRKKEKSKNYYTKFTIHNIDFEKNKIIYGCDDNIENDAINSIDKFIEIISTNPCYISNISLLKNWKGFSTDTYVYITEILTDTLDLLIYIYEFYTLSFKYVPTNQISSFLLRASIAYECKSLGNRLWYIKTNDTVTVVSDRQIYTPIDSTDL